MAWRLERSLPDPYRRAQIGDLAALSTDLSKNNKEVDLVGALAQRGEYVNSAFMVFRNGFWISKIWPLHLQNR